MKGGGKGDGKAGKTGKDAKGGKNKGKGGKQGVIDQMNALADETQLTTTESEVVDRARAREGSVAGKVVRYRSSRAEWVRNSW